MLDINNDKRLDIATGWEEGGVIRAYLHPGNAKVTERWPMIEVGKVKSPEDAVFVDLDGDGDEDIVSCSEGRTRTVHFHWSPRNDPQRKVLPWRTQAVPVTAGKQSWMFAVPLWVDEKGMDLVLGSKGTEASIGWLQSPNDPRAVGDWRFHRWYDAGWVMSLIKADMDGDGDLDVLASDRRSRTPGVLWLENPGVAAMQKIPRNVGRRTALVRLVARLCLSRAQFETVGGSQGERKDHRNLCRRAAQSHRGVATGKDVKQPWDEEVITYSLDRFGTAKARARGGFGWEWSARNCRQLRERHG